MLNTTVLNGPLVSFTMWSLCSCLPVFIEPRSLSCQHPLKPRAASFSKVTRWMCSRSRSCLAKITCSHNGSVCPSDLLSNILLSSAAWIWLTSILRFWNMTHLISKRAVSFLAVLFYFVFIVFSTPSQRVRSSFISVFSCASVCLRSLCLSFCLSLSLSRLSSACVTACSGQLRTHIVI